MAHRKDDRDQPATPPARGGETAAPAAPTPGGPRDFTAEVERLADGRYILYYAWPTADAVSVPAPRRTRRTRPADR